MSEPGKSGWTFSSKAGQPCDAHRPLLRAHAWNHTSDDVLELSAAFESGRKTTGLGRTISGIAVNS
jgi:hypothetical protein